MLDTVDEAVVAGLAHRWATALWRVSDDRVHRWRARRAERGGGLEDRRRGGAAVHALLPQEVDAILEIAEHWGPTDRSHRKLAHRGSYENSVWCHRLRSGVFWTQTDSSRPRRRRGGESRGRPWPPWLVWEPNRIWIWDATHFGRARRCVFAIVDMVSRRWISTVVSSEESSTQVRVVFDDALAVEGLIDLLTDERLDLPLDDPRRPILLAVSDNGGPMISTDTRAFMAAVAIAQHHGRPRTPNDQAWIESFFGHIKGEWPHLCDIDDPALLETELHRARSDYNNIRLHEAIGYVTPNDEHHRHGEAIRQARNTACNKPARTGSTTTAGPLSTTPTRPNDTVDSQHHLRGRLRNTSGLGAARRVAAEPALVPHQHHRPGEAVQVPHPLGSTLLDPPRERATTRARRLLAPGTHHHLQHPVIALEGAGHLELVEAHQPQHRPSVASRLGSRLALVKLAPARPRLHERKVRAGGQVSPPRSAG